MRILLNKPIVVNEQTCIEADVSVALSTGLALRVVPVDVEGNQHPEGTISVVGRENLSDVAAFMEKVSVAVKELLAGRGN
jgi:hypothetical protein